VPGDPRRFDDLFQFFGSVTVRRMFGGEGIFADDRMIALVGSDDQMYLKTDETTRKAFTAEKYKPFSFKKGGKTIDTAYCAVPDRLLDDPEEFAQWAKRAHDVARAASKKKPRRKR
jgi:DNA transformation protein and related proteins